MSLRRLFLLREELSDSECEDLLMFQHSKELLGEYSRRFPSLEKAMSLHGEVTPVPLYRGLPPGRGNGVTLGAQMAFRGYPSFSESLETASRFARETGALVELTRPCRGFCYYRWLEAEFRSMDPESYEMSDGDWTIQDARREAEWILPFGSHFSVLRIREDSSLRIVTVA